MFSINFLYVKAGPLVYARVSSGAYTLDLPYIGKL